MATYELHLDCHGAGIVLRWLESLDLKRIFLQDIQFDLILFCDWLILRQLSIISYSDFPSLNLLSWKLSSSLIFVLWWPTKMHVKKRSDVQLKIRVEGEIRARGKIKLEVLLPCRGDLGLGSWLSSNHLKEENIICSISKSQPNPKQSDRCGLGMGNPGSCICLNFPYEIKPEQLLRRWSFIKLIGRNCVVWGINPLSNPFMVRAIKTDIWRHE